MASITSRKICWTATRGGDSEQVIGEFTKAGMSVDKLAGQLQEEGATRLFVSSWNELMAAIASKRAALNQAVTS